MHKPGFVYALLAAFHSIHATPMDPLSQLKCDCVSFSSGDATPCSMPDTRNLDWLSAQHIASVHELPIQFASSQVVSSILDANTPLPTSLLLRMIDGTPVPPQVTPSKYSTDWIICGIDETDDMDRRLNGDEDAHTYDVFVLQVIIAVILIVIIYEAGDVFVRSVQKKMSKDHRAVQLTGEEKPLRAEGESSDNASRSEDNLRIHHEDR